jgi:hypothetical protein
MNGQLIIESEKERLFPLVFAFGEIVAFVYVKRSLRLNAASFSRVFPSYQWRQLKERAS